MKVGTRKTICVSVSVLAAALAALALCAYPAAAQSGSSQSVSVQPRLGNLFLSTAGKPHSKIQKLVAIGGGQGREERAPVPSPEKAQGPPDDTERSGDERALLNRVQQRVSGYLQFRFDDLLGGDSSLFRASGASGTGQLPSVSGPSVGGPRSGFLIRRGRIKVADRLSNRDEFSFQVDLPSNGALNVRDAFIRVHDFPAKHLSVRAGQYAFPYGFELVRSSRSRETPERALGFSDSTQATLIFKSEQSSIGGVVTSGSVLPFFIDQDRDIGIELAYDDDPRRQRTGTFTPRLSFNVLQGEGRAAAGQRSLNNVYDIMISAEEVQKRDGNETSFGVSFYDGAMPVRSGPPVRGGEGENAPAVLAPFRNAERTFGGIYARFRGRHRQELRAEYSRGLYEVTPDRAQFLDSNQFSAWYVTARHPIRRGLDGYAKYDEFAPTSKTVAGLSPSQYTRRTLSLGLLYDATDATRFRLNYSQGLTPYDPSVSVGSPYRAKLGLLQVDIQQVF